MTVARVPSPPSIPTGPYAFVPRLPVPDATPLPACDAAVAELRVRADAWVRTSPERKAALLDEVMRATIPVADRWTELGSLHEGLAPDGRDSVEEGIVGPYIFLRGVRFHRTPCGRSPPMAARGSRAAPGCSRTAVWPRG